MSGRVLWLGPGCVLAAVPPGQCKWPGAEGQKSGGVWEDLVACLRRPPWEAHQRAPAILEDCSDALVWFFFMTKAGSGGQVVAFQETHPGQDSFHVMWALLLGTVTGRAEWDVGAWRSVTRGSSFPGTLGCLE